MLMIFTVTHIIHLHTQDAMLSGNNYMFRKFEHPTHTYTHIGTDEKHGLLYIISCKIVDSWPCY